MIITQNLQTPYNPLDAMSIYNGVELLTNGMEYLPALAGVHGINGLGDAQSESQIVSTAGTGAGATTSVLAATGVIAGSTAAIALPIIGVVVAGIIFWLNRKGPQQKIETTKIVNDAEPLLKQNLAVWNSSPKTKSIQTQMLANYDAVWAKVVQLCSDSRYGDPGHACVNDRLPSGKFPWSVYYRDPIANDPNVQPDTVVGSVTDSAIGASSAVSSMIHSVTGIDVGVGGALLGLGAILLIMAID